MEKTRVQYHPERERLWSRFFKIKVDIIFRKKPIKLDCMQIFLTRFYMQAKSKINENKNVFDKHGRYR